MNNYMIGFGLLLLAQVISWFQSNLKILPEPFSNNYIIISIVVAPFLSLLFANGVAKLYEIELSLWSIRFITFGFGYLVFIPLTWYFFGEEIITLKNVLSFLLCLALICIQFYLK